MTIEEFLDKVKKGGRVSFQETMKAIKANFIYTPVQFTNGLGEGRVVNAAGKNEGSCKIFALGKRYGLSKEETLVLFGELYWRDVLEHPDGADHSNIRTFMRDGWDGIEFEAEPLKVRE
jgi:hypothetical protein